MTASVRLLLLAALFCPIFEAVCQTPSIHAGLSVDQREQKDYMLGPDDTIAISVLQAPEMTENRPIRIDFNGRIALPYIGQLQAAGMTVPELREHLVTKLTSIIKQPQVTVSVLEFNSQPVSILGAVNSPGVRQIHDRKLLTDVLAVAGGLRQDAGPSVMITRRVQQGNIPLPSAKKDPTGEFYVASLELKGLMEAKHPEENIPILPHDIVSVPVAEMVYVMGEVTKPGGFALGNKREMSVSSALAMAGGLTRTADWTGGKVMRSTHGDGHAYKEFPVNIRNILAGKEQDFQLQAEDIVFVPSSAAKTAKMRAIEAAVQVATGVAIWSSR